MAKITIKGDTSGEVDIVVPAVAGSTTYNLSTSGGNVLSDNDIGTTVQGYDANTAKYDDTTANFTGTLQQGGNAVATQAYVDSEVGAISVTPTAVSGQNNTSTSYFDLPAGTTAQRPASPATGMMRYNTTESEYEAYDGSEWKIVSTSSYPYTAEILMVAGGGAGGTSLHGGGGGAGGTTITSTTFVSGEGAKTIVIGAGASNGTSNPAPNGGNTSFTGLTTVLGGGGGCTRQATGATGGCGGGAGYEGAGGTGTSGQGFNGGLGVRSPDYRGGGGGGSAEAGWGGGSTRLGAGGDGKEFPTGSGTYYGGGGGGSCYGSASVPVGGAGGGGNGARGDVSVIAENGTANTGGGGGGRERNSNSGGAGGSGIVIIRYAGSQKGTGGTVTSSGGYTTHTFTSSGTYIP